MESFDFGNLLNILLTLIASLICITLHELSHGFVAYKLGDGTAKNMGRLSLNPIRHIDWIGLLMMVVFKVGWAKPVPVNIHNFKTPKRDMAITAMAGPLSNIVISVVALLFYGLLYIPLVGYTLGDYVLHLLELIAYISLGFAVFNLIPLPPLDGAKIMYWALKDEHYIKIMDYEGYGTVILMVLMFTGTLGHPIAVIRQLIYNDLISISQWACDIVAILFYI